jgi:hypothetical protein
MREYPPGPGENSKGDRKNRSMDRFGFLWLSGVTDNPGQGKEISQIVGTVVMEGLHDQHFLDVFLGGAGDFCYLSLLGFKFGQGNIGEGQPDICEVVLAGETEEQGEVLGGQIQAHFFLQFPAGGRRIQVTIQEIADTYLGYSLYMPLDQFNEALGLPQNSYSILLSS